MKEKPKNLPINVIFGKILDIYNKGQPRNKQAFTMEKYFEDFDNSSKEVIEDLIKENSKMNMLINKLQKARKSIDSKDKFLEALTEVKK